MWLGRVMSVALCVSVVSQSFGQGLELDKTGQSYFDAILANNLSLRQFDVLGTTEVYDDIGGKKVSHMLVRWRMACDVDAKTFLFIQSGDKVVEDLAEDNSGVKTSKAVLLDAAMLRDGVAIVRSFPGRRQELNYQHESDVLSRFIIPDVRTAGIDSLPKYWSQKVDRATGAKFVHSRYLINKISSSSGSTQLDAKLMRPSAARAQEGRDLKTSWVIDNATTMPIARRVFYEDASGPEIKRQAISNESFKFKSKSGIFVPTELSTTTLEGERDKGGVTLFERSTVFKLYWSSVNEPRKLMVLERDAFEDFDHLQLKVSPKSFGFESLDAAIESIK